LTPSRTNGRHGGGERKSRTDFGNNLGFYLASPCDVLVQTAVMVGQSLIDESRNGGIMNATAESSYMTREAESIPSQEPITHPVHTSGACRRCGGLLVEEHCMDMDIGKIGRGHWAKRCIQCGDMIDETILRNREVPLRTYQEIDPAADIGRSFDASPSHSGKGGRYASVSHASATIRSHTTLQTIARNR
jgi:hypothetical protein